MKVLSFLENSRSSCKKIKTFLIYLILCVNVLSSRKAHQQRNSSQIRSHKRLLHMMIKNVDKAIKEHVTEFMNCTNVHGCRVETAGLRLKNLPNPNNYNELKSSREINANEWIAVFETQLEDLHCFHCYLNEIINSSTANFGPTSRPLMLNLKNLLFQLITALQTQMVEIYNLDVQRVISSQSRPVRFHTNLPSPSLQVIRNHIFMIEFHDYLLNFLNLFHHFTCNSQSVLRIRCSKNDVYRFRAHLSSV